MISDDDLLDAALEAFAERGFDGTSVRQLARALDVSHNLIPQRFGTKERLWYAAGPPASIVSEIEAVGGRHDEASIYGGPAGDPGLAGGPGSVSWRVNADLAAVSLAGPAAILMEVLEPSVMAGVEEHSSYRTDPVSRAKNTLGPRTPSGTSSGRRSARPTPPPR